MASPLPDSPIAPHAPSQSEPSDAGSEIFVARQPILNAAQGLYAYELLYRSGRKNVYDGVSGALATTDVILNSLLHIGMERLVGRNPAFVNFDRELLLGEMVELLPTNIVMEVLETVAPDKDVVARCRDLRKRGFKIALDDVTDLEAVGELITVADFVKVDFRAAGRREQEIVARKAAQRSIVLLAEKVETSEEFETALELGYKLAQGFFFAKPKIIPGSNLPPNKLVFLRLLREVNSPEPNIIRIEETLKHEPALVYKLLRYVNSAAFGWKQPIGSIKHALALLGTEQIHKWIGLLALSALTERTPAPLAPAAIVRARFCELIAIAAGLQSRGPELFLLGMLSLFDAILRRPMEEIIEQVELNEDVRCALLNPGSTAGKIADLYSLVTAYEAGSWEFVDECALRLGLSRIALATAYTDSVRWAEDLGSV